MQNSQNKGRYFFTNDKKLLCDNHFLRVENEEKKKSIKKLFDIGADTA